MEMEVAVQFYFFCFCEIFHRVHLLIRFSNNCSKQTEKSFHIKIIPPSAWILLFAKPIFIIGEREKGVSWARFAALYSIRAGAVCEKGQIVKNLTT